jgi:uncharacterized protein (TIGR03435 family)
MDAGKAPMPNWLDAGVVLGRPVIDQTGFSGLLDVHLKFTPDENTQGLPAAPCRTLLRDRPEQAEYLRRSAGTTWG